MLMDALRAWRRHPPASPAVAVLTLPPASDRLAPAGLSAPPGSPAVCSVRRAAVTVAEAPHVVEIDPDFEPLSQPDFSQSSSASSSLAPSRDSTRNPDAAAGLPSASARAACPAAARGAAYPLRTASRRPSRARLRSGFRCRGASTVGHASGVKPMATARRAG
ncbi:Forkhead box protein O1, partial [Manis javanica]